VGKQRRRLTKESVIQPTEAGMDLAVSSLPDAKFHLILLTVSLPEIHQLQKLSIALFILGILHHAELLHLGVVLCCKLLLLLSQPLLKL
jgi:hypothetical protein